MALERRNVIELVGEIVSDPVKVEVASGANIVSYEFTVRVQRSSGNSDDIVVRASDSAISDEIKLGDKVCLHGDVRVYKGCKTSNVMGCALANNKLIYVNAKNVKLATDTNLEVCKINECELVGDIVRIEKVKMLENGNRLLPIELDVSRNNVKFKKQCILQVTIWESCINYVSQASCGDKLRVKGRLHSRRLKGQDILIYEIAAFDVDLLRKDDADKEKEQN